VGSYEDTISVLGPDAQADSVDGALARFMQRRYQRCRMVVENSMQLSDWDKHPGDPQADPAGLSDATFAALAAPF
jgi:hypothetical protein